MVGSTTEPAKRAHLLDSLKDMVSRVTLFFESVDITVSACTYAEVMRIYDEPGDVSMDTSTHHRVTNVTVPVALVEDAEPSTSGIAKQSPSKKRAQPAEAEADAQPAEVDAAIP